MKTSWRYQVVYAIVLVLVSFVAGQLLPRLGEGAEDRVDARPIAEGVVLTAAMLPELEVPGSDVAGLPRYPGATRVEYRQMLDGEFVITEVEYLVVAEFDEVQQYYRNIFFEEGWTVADLAFEHGEWKFFVLIGNREALLEIEMLGRLVEIEIEISESGSSDTLATPYAGVPFRTRQ